METDVFGLGGTPPEETLGLVEEEQEITADEAETVPEEQPSEDEGQPRDEQGRFVAKEASEETEEPREEEGTEAEPEPELAEATEAPQAEEAQAPEEVEEAPRLWAGKYQDPEALEEGYRNSQEMWRRANESRKAEEAERQAAQYREQELQRIMQEALPFLKQAAAREQWFRNFAEQYRQETGQYPEGYQPAPAPQAQTGVAPQDVQRLVDQRLEQERAAMYERLQAEQQYEQLTQAVMSFYQDHPEVPQRSPADEAITDAAMTLDTSPAWQARDETVDMADRETLELMYEVSQRPALLEVLALRPDYFDSEAGMQLARRDASVLEGNPAATQETRTVPASQVGKTAGQRKPFAESATTGAEAEEQEDPNDPWGAIKRDVANRRSPASVFTFE